MQLRPARRSGERPTDRLAALTSILGRDIELAVACELLCRADRIDELVAPSLASGPTVRLLTLTGPGGVGKTRLAFAIAATLEGDFPDGAVWADLAPTLTPSDVAAAISRSLGLRDETSQSTWDRVQVSISGRRILLVLDNFEHVLDAAPMVANLLRTCPQLTILVTSRERLRVSGEHEQPVSSLRFPDAATSAEEALATPAVQLFLERARAVVPGLSVTEESAIIAGEICRRLDGLPLAIELAASRVKVFPPAELLSRLDQKLLLLTGGPRDAPDRLRTMRDAIAWSYELLTSEERELFCRLSVFVNGFSLEAAEAVGRERLRTSVLDLVAGLVEKSLVVVRQDPTGGTRYAILEMIREFGWERLAAGGELDDACRSHAAYTLFMAEQLEPELYGGRDLMRCLATLEAEHANLRAALTWLAQGDEPTLGLRLAVSLLRYWMIHGHLSEGKEWLERTVDAAPDAPALLRAKALTGIALLAWPQDAQERALEALHQAAALVDGTTDFAALAFVRLAQAWIALDRGDTAAAVRWAIEAEAQYERLGRRRDTLMATRCLARAAHTQGDVPRADTLYAALITAAEDLGDDYGLATSRHGLGLLRAAQDDHAQALALQRQALAGYQELGERLWVTACLEAIATTVSAMGQAEPAARLLGAAETLRTQTGLPTWFADQAVYEKSAGTARASLGDKAFSAAWDTGAAATLDEVVTAVDAIVDSVVAVQHIGVDPTAPFNLSPREVEVLRLIAQGRTDQETADLLSVSRRTVHTHVASILNKLAAENRTAAVATAVRFGLA